jgi:hypothetical protein
LFNSSRNSPLLIDAEPFTDHLRGLVVRVRGYRSRGPGSIPGATRFFFLEVMGLKRGPLSLMSTIEELLEGESSGSGL